MVLGVAAGLAGGIVALLALWGLFESQWPRLRVQEVPIRGLPEALDGFRVIHLSDLHLGAVSLGSRSVRKAVGWAHGRMPDLIAITGDLLSSGRGEPELRRAINALEARHGVLAILGNHEVDVTRDPFSRAPEPGAFPGDGAELLRDSAVSFDVAGCRVLVAGLDPASYLARASSLDQLSAETADLSILLSHYPEVVDRAGSEAFALVLAGHTHDGQICIPWPRGKLRLAHPRARYPFGTFELNRGRTTLVVSAGLGTTFVPFRLAARPEAVELVLRRTSEASVPARGTL